MKKLLVLLASATFVFTGFMAQADAKRRGCNANYCDASGRKCTGWKYLGKVGGFFKNKKKACLNLAKSKAAAYAKYIYAKSTSLCGKRWKVNIDSEVDGKRNSRDGSVTVLNGGWRCVKKYRCARGWQLVGTRCRKAYSSWCKACACKLALKNGNYGPYKAVSGYLYKKCTKYRYVNASSYWYIY